MRPPLSRLPPELLPELLPELRPELLLPELDEPPELLGGGLLGRTLPRELPLLLLLSRARSRLPLSRLPFSRLPVRSRVVDERSPLFSVLRGTTRAPPIPSMTRRGALGSEAVLDESPDDERGRSSSLRIRLRHELSRSGRLLSGVDGVTAGAGAGVA